MASLPSLPRSAETYAREQRTEIQAAVASLLRLWRRMGDDFDPSWFVVGPQMLEVLDLAQERVTAGALAYVPAVLAETDQRLYDPAYDVEATALVGTAGDGRPTESLLYGGVTHAKQAVAAGASASAALATASSFITLAAGTVLSDTGRSAEKMAGHARRVTGYVRMLQPPSCGRCVVLAGSWTSAKTAFRRHPGCDCRNIPSAEATSDDETVSPEGYLSSLPSASELTEQYPDLTVKERRKQGLISLEDALGSKANAQAFRDGADPIQLVNAYRKKSGVRAAQVYSERIKYTTEGTTRRGLAYRAMDAAGLTGGAARRQAGDRYLAARNVRLMPETIYARAANRVQALQMLRDYGWIR